MKYKFLVVLTACTLSLVSANQVATESPDKELLSQVYILVEELVTASKDLPAQKQQQFQMSLQQLLQILMAQFQIPMQEEAEELVAKISPTKYAQLQKLQKTIMEKLEKAIAPINKEAAILDKKRQTITQKVLADNASIVKQMEALQAQIQVEIDQYMQQMALQSNGVLP